MARLVLAALLVAALSRASAAAEARPPADAPAGGKGAPTVVSEASRTPAEADKAPAAEPQRPTTDFRADQPPPTDWDRAQAGEGDAPPDEGRTVLSQLVRTVLSLLFVVALIYVLAKVGLTRLGRFKGASGPGLRVVERLQVDTKNALLVVEVAGKHKLLLGSGAQGLSLVARLDDVATDGGRPGDGKASFQETLARAQRPAASADDEPRGGGDAG